MVYLDSFLSVVLVEILSLTVSEVFIEKGGFVGNLDGLCLGDPWLPGEGFVEWKDDDGTICSFGFYCRC